MRTIVVLDELNTKLELHLQYRNVDNKTQSQFIIFFNNSNIVTILVFSHCERRLFYVVYRPFFSLPAISPLLPTA
jgi:hypothetical protein